LLEGLAGKFTAVPVYRKELAGTCNSLGSVRYQQRDWPAARKYWERARMLYQSLADDFEEVPEYRLRQGMVTGNLGLLCLERKQGWRRVPARADLLEARAFLQEGITLLNAGLKLDPQNAFFQKLRKTQTQQLNQVNGLLGDPPPQ
jgi:hypothetical protein